MRISHGTIPARGSGHPMDTRALELFSRVIKHGSFAAAAREENIDPSSVSRVISALETDLGVRLFQRNTRRLSLTEAGIVYSQRIEPLIEEMQQARQAAADVSARVTGTLRVTASNAFGLKFVVPRLPAFAEKYPDLAVDLMLTDAVVDLLAERVDLAIRLGTLPDSSMVAQLLMYVRYRVVANPMYLRKYGAPAKPAQVSEHNCLVFPLPGFRSMWMFRDKKGVQNEIPIKGKLLVSNFIGLQQCALAGMGLALLPDWMAQDDIRSGKLVDLFPKWEIAATDFKTAAWFVYPSRSYVPLKVRVFIDFLRTP